MKYENLKQVNVLCEKIVRFQEQLDSLNSPQTTVIINSSEQSGRIMTIGVHERYEHQYQPLADKFVNSIREDLKKQIKELNEELEPL
jgi:glutamine amidotransferase-like uncharacterized protein